MTSMSLSPQAQAIRRSQRLIQKNQTRKNHGLRIVPTSSASI